MLKQMWQAYLRSQFMCSVYFRLHEKLHLSHTLTHPHTLHTYKNVGTRKSSKLCFFGWKILIEKFWMENFWQRNFWRKMLIVKMLVRNFLAGKNWGEALAGKTFGWGKNWREKNWREKFGGIHFCEKKWRENLWRERTFTGKVFTHHPFDTHPTV